jgi:C-terminal processing protease CtpA/Prc
MRVQPDAERQAMFDHVWRQVKQKFYRADLHGVDWDYYRSQYQPKLAGITNARDFATLLSEILGELNGSHTGGRYRPRDPGGEPTASLGFFPDYDYDGDGIRIAEVMARGPLDNSELDITAGAVILAVDGVALDSSTNYYQQLAGKAGQRVRLRLRQDGKTEEKVVTPINGASTFTLRYDRWVKQRRDLVEEASRGRVGYVHVRGMNDRSFRTVYSEVLGRYFDAEAIIVDTRYNGGGWLHDDLVTFLSGVHYTDFAPRNQAAEGQRFFGEPGRRWVKPSAVVMSEGNYSDAHAFPWAYKELGIGPLIGMPVAGTSTAVWWERLHTGEIIFGIPQVGMMDLDDGSYLENAQLEPDYRVELDPESAARGEDPQLLKAVEVLLGEGR